jgi:hypothetical protein
MRKRESFEICAEQDENGTFVCHEESIKPVPHDQDQYVQNQPVPDEAETSSVFREHKYSDINEIFHKTYQSNYFLKNNKLLYEAQERLKKMQDKILDNIKVL